MWLLRKHAPICLALVAALAAGSQTDILMRSINMGAPRLVNRRDVPFTALEGARVAGGVVQLSGCSSPSDEYIELEPLERLGEALSIALPDSKIVVNDGLVNVFPASGLPALLGTRLDHVRLQGEVAEMAGKILVLPEVQNAVIRLGIREWQDGGGLYLPNAERIDVEMDSGSLLNLLNAVAKADGTGVWSYREGSCERRRGFSLDFPVRR